MRDQLIGVTIKSEVNQIRVGSDQLIGGHPSHNDPSIRVSEELVVEAGCNDFETHQTPRDVFPGVQESQTFLIHREGLFTTRLCQFCNRAHMHIHGLPSQLCNDIFSNLV